MEENTFYPVSYEDGVCKFRAFKLREATKFTKLSKVMRNPIKKEEVQFKTLVDIFRPLLVIPNGKTVEDLDIMAFRELAIMSSSYSSKDHATYYSFKCDYDKLDNPEKETKQLVYNNLSKDKDVSEEELAELKELIDSMPDFIPCNHTIKNSIAFDKLGSDIPNLFQRVIIEDGSKYKVHYYTVNHKLMLDQLEYEFNNNICTMSDLSMTEDINTIEIDKINKDTKIIFDILKVSLHTLDTSELSVASVIDRYNELIDCDSRVFQSVSDRIKTTIEEKPKLIDVSCPNCGTEYKIRFDVEDFKLIPD